MEKELPQGNNHNEETGLYKEVDASKSKEMKLIINADDLGICRERDEGIFELFEKGCISSASILMNSINCEESICRAKKVGLPLGLHLNLTEGQPVFKWKIEQNSLVYYDEVKDCYSMYGKFDFRNRFEKGAILESDISNEIIHQCLKFVQLYNNIPSHVDGHQHVHVIPKIARIISHTITSYFGIYQIRLPLEEPSFIDENVCNDDSRKFYKEVIAQSEKSKRIFDSFNISYPSYFIGMSLMGRNLNEENIGKQLDYIRNKVLRSSESEIINNYVELMCHPGNIPDQFFWDDFNSSCDRLYEKESLIKMKHYFVKEKLDFSNFSQIPANQNIKSNKRKSNILLLGDFTFGTGNCITAIRFKDLITKLNHNCYLFNIKYINSNLEDEDKNISKLENFILQKKINLIIGIHIWRAGRVINLLRRRSSSGLGFINLPYILICSGTDANQFVDCNKSKEVMKEAIQNCETFISFNDEMISKLKKNISDIDTILFKVIPQSVNIEDLNLDDVGLKHIDNNTNIDNSEFNFSIRKHFNIPKNYRVILFPAGIRCVKDPKFILNELLEFLDEFEDFVVILIGARLDNKLYEEIKSTVASQERFIIHDVVVHKDFIKVLKESDVVINSSINEGMSNVLMEAMKVGVPVIARKNEGNCRLIQHEVNGLLYETPEEFKQMFNRIINPKHVDQVKLKGDIIVNAKQTMLNSFSRKNESQEYEDLITKVLDKYYFTFKFEKKEFELFFGKKVHPYSEENNEIFKHAILNCEKYSKIGDSKVNILDVGCGSGIFSIIFLLQNTNLQVNELVLTDIEENCLFSSYQNYTYLRDYFRINKITLIKSDLLSEFFKNQRLNKKYANYFDIVLANMPQTPSKNSIRKDKHGGKEGSELYVELFQNQIKPFIKTFAPILILHISLSNPIFLDNFIKSQDFTLDILFEQNRTLNPDDLNSLTSNLKDYFLQLNSENKCIFEQISEKEWKYQVWLKCITNKN